MDPNQVASVDDLDAPATYATPKKRLRRTTRQARKRLTDASMPSVVEAATPSMTNDSIQAGRNIRRRINQVVTPVGDDDDDASPAQEEVSNRQPKARRALRMDESQQVVPVTPSPQDLTSRARDNLRHHGSGHTPNAKRKLLFGRHVSQIHCPANVENIYNIVKKHTGSLGGNAIGGAIYGELTMGSMQKMVNLMKQHTNLSANSVFLDVGSGIGKPNLHVAQDPGVHTSIGIEMDADRYLLGMTCLKAVLDAATQQQEEHGQPSQPADLENSLSGTTARTVTSTETIGCKCFFIHENVLDANTLDPFTHVYMFSIGFPPKLWRHLAAAFNRSSSPFLICYHSPKDIIQKYQFAVELISQTPTSMHGSKEGHTGYIYQRITLKPPPFMSRPCDELFKTSMELVQAGLDSVKGAVDRELQLRLSSQSVTRSKAKSKRDVPSRVS